MLRGRRVAVVVPAYAEEQHVARVLLTMPPFVDRVLVIDDGSPDRTSAAAEAVGDPRSRVVRHAVRRGVGAAIATGYARALAETTHDADAIAVMAGDGQMAPEDLENVVTPVVLGEADYVKGTRFSDARVQRAMGLPRYVGGKVFSWLTGLAIAQAITDSQCGYTAIARGALSAIDASALWPSFGYPNDLLGMLAARRLRIAEVAVQPIYGSETSKLRLRHLPPIFYLIGRAALRRRRAVTPSDDSGPGGLRAGSAVSS